jgi:hypothetical protein
LRRACSSQGAAPTRSTTSCPAARCVCVLGRALLAEAVVKGCSRQHSHTAVCVCPHQTGLQHPHTGQAGSSSRDGVLLGGRPGRRLPHAPVCLHALMHLLSAYLLAVRLPVCLHACAHTHMCHSYCQHTLSAQVAVDFVSLEAVSSALQQHGHLRALDLAHGNVLAVSRVQQRGLRGRWCGAVCVCVAVWVCVVRGV